MLFTLLRRHRVLMSKASCPLAVRQVLRDRRLLGRVDGELVVVLDLDPSLHVRADKAAERRDPLGDILVACAGSADAFDY